MAQFSVACCSSPADGVAGSVLLQSDGESGPKVARVALSATFPRVILLCYAVPVQCSRRCC